MKSIFRRKAGLAAALLIQAAILLGSGCSLLPDKDEILAPPLIESVKIEYKTIVVTRGTLIRQLRMTGSFYPEIQRTMTFGKIGGRIKSLNVRAGQMVKAGDLIAELDSDSLISDIRIKELDIEKIKLDISRLYAGKADSYSIKQAKIDLQQQQIRLEDMQKQLAATMIKAPIEGKIIYLINVSIGDYVSAYQMIARIVDTRNLVLVSNAVGTAELPIGAEVTVEFQELRKAGEVIANPSTLGNDPDEYLHNAAIIRLKAGVPIEATMGSNATIIYTQEKRENVLVLPRSEINVLAARHYVNALKDGVRIERDVEIGLMTDTEAEISKGLSEGDLVITN